MVIWFENELVVMVGVVCIGVKILIRVSSVDEGCSDENADIIRGAAAGFT